MQRKSLRQSLSNIYSPLPSLPPLSQIHASLGDTHSRALSGVAAGLFLSRVNPPPFRSLVVLLSPMIAHEIDL